MSDSKHGCLVTDCINLPLCHGCEDVHCWSKTVIQMCSQHAHTRNERKIFSMRNKITFEENLKFLVETVARIRNLVH